MPDFEDRAFGEWSLADVTNAISEEIDESVGEAGYDANKLFAEDKDHWQDGDQWVGPRGTDVTKAAVLARVKPQFTPVDAIGECLDRMANGLLAREADVDFVPIKAAGEDGQPSSKQADRADRMRELMAEWWDDQSFWLKVRSAVKRSRWGARGLLRLGVAEGALEEVRDKAGRLIEFRLPSGLDMRSALARVDVDAPLPDESLVYRNPKSRERAALFLFEEDKIQLADIWFLEQGATVLRRVSQGETSAPEDSDAETFVLDMGGRLPISQMRADLMITEPIRRQQNRLNFVESILNRVSETAGFAERYIANAEPEGVWQVQKPANIVNPRSMEFEGTTYYLHAEPRTLGASVLTELRGVTEVDEDGKERIKEPKVTFKEPTDPEFAIKAARHAKTSLYEACNQLHVLISGDATASGKSREQARADFEDDLRGVKPALEGMVRDTLAALIAFAEAMSTQSGFLDEFRIVVNANIHTGPISAEEQSQNNANVEKGTLSRETAMALNGVEDVGSEVSKIAEQPDAQLDMLKRQVEVIQLLVAAYPETPMLMAMKIAGVVELDEETDETVEGLIEAFDEEQVTARAQARAEGDEINAALAVLS